MAGGGGLGKRAMTAPGLALLQKQQECRRGLARVLEKDVVRDEIADFEIHLFLAGVGGEIQVFIEHAVPETIRPRFAVIRAEGGADLVDFQKPPHQFVARIKLQNAVGARPVLNITAEFILLLLRAAAEQTERANRRAGDGKKGSEARLIHDCHFLL